MKQVLIVGSGNAFSSDGRAQTCFLLEAGHDRIVVDCGATSLMQMQRLQVDVAKIDRLIVTHFHGDHIGGIPFLLLHFEFIVRRTAPFEILGPVGVQQKINDLLNCVYPGTELSYQLKFTELTEGKKITTGSFEIEALAMSHQPESLGYRITDGIHFFAFSGDTRWCNNIERLYDGVDVGILELSLIRQPPGGTSHIAADEVIANRSLLKAKQLYFNHIYNDAASAVDEYQSVHGHIGTPLNDGMVIRF